MKAFIVDRYKKKGALRFGDMPEPVLQDDDVLVQAHAAGLNLLDSKIRDGEFKLILPYRPPFILGHDVAGTVVRVGSKVGKFKPGDEIYARPRDGRVGTFAELIALNEADIALKPKNLSMEEAASIPLVGLTAWQVLVERTNLKKGRRSSFKGLRRRGHIRHSAREAYRRYGRDDDEHGERRAGQGPRRRCRRRLQKGKFREGPVRLRRSAEQPGRRHAAEIPERPEARRQAHLDLRSAGPRFLPRRLAQAGSCNKSCAY
jgi:Alcohol dehydrogenase GroES-like domain